MAPGTATSWEVKKYLQAEIQKLRATGKSWPTIQKTLGPFAWATWLMVEHVPPPAPDSPTNPDNSDSARTAVVSHAEMEVKK